MGNDKVKNSNLTDWDSLPEGYNYLSDEQKKVYEVLLTPIKIKDRNDKIYIDKDEMIIFSGQKYCRKLDEDMSDFAVKFYEEIYDITILQSRYLKSPIFCGDTMNSYNYIAKLAGKEKKEKWLSSYHCLANFWILPMDVGHSSSWTGKRGLMRLSKSKNGINDYMDNFLQYYCTDKDFKKEFSKAASGNKIYKNWNGECTSYSDYVERFKQDLQEFSNNHFLNESYIKDNKVLKFSCHKEPRENKDSGDATIEEMWERIKIRAVQIAREKGGGLYDFFKKEFLIN